MTTTQYHIGINWAKSRYIGLPTPILMAQLSIAFDILPTSRSPDYMDGCIDGLTEMIECRVSERPLADFLEEF